MIETILAILATYRIAALIATEEGAFSIFARIRERIDPAQATWIGRGLNCPLCVGFWVALALTMLIVHEPLDPLGLRVYLVHWFGIAGGAMLVQKWTERWD